MRRIRGAKAAQPLTWTYRLFFCFRVAVYAALLFHAYPQNASDHFFWYMLPVVVLELSASVKLFFDSQRPIRRIDRMIRIMEGGTTASNVDYLLKSDGQRNGSDTDRLTHYIKQVLQANYDSQILKSQAEIHALQSQINPHFLYNTLETIRSQAVLLGCDAIEEMTEALAVLFRYSISQPAEMATLEQELDNIDHYLLIQQYRFPDKFHVEKYIEDSSLLQYKVPVLTLQPLIENAIHHGLEMKMGQGTVQVRILHTQSRLLIIIADDGLGMSEERLEEVNQALKNSDQMASIKQNGAKRQSGIALINVNRRIQFYFGKEYGLYLYSLPDIGTTVELSLPNNPQAAGEGAE